mgnify:CR=1 FL=1
MCVPQVEGFYHHSTYIDLQCTDPLTTDVEIEAGERLIDELNDMSNDDIIRVFSNTFK